ncbi:MAG: ABC transporter substrate-binding protein [Candidatus Tectomicrobia bacterium]|nr:ABC transporter substrate-binding protein [Candidatus Tectomicrobia bacterium]
MKRRLGLILAVLASVGLFWTSGPSAAAEKISVVVNPSFGFAFIFDLNRFAKKYDLELTFRRMATFGQQQQALELGQADVGTIGYQNLVLMAVAGGAPKAQAVAGVYLSGQDVVFNKNVKITKWKDIEGKTIARIPGTFAEFLFRAAAIHNGVDLSKVKLKDFAYSPSTLTLSLERRDIDGLVIWVPTLAYPIAKGVGYRPPISVNDTPVGNINALFAASRSFIEGRPDVLVKLMKAYVEAVDAYVKDPDIWVKQARAITGAEQDVLKESLNHITLHAKMYPARARELAKLSHSLNMVKKDVSGTITQWMRFDFLQKATGKSLKELGG